MFSILNDCRPVPVEAHSNPDASTANCLGAEAVAILLAGIIVEIYNSHRIFE